MRNTDNGAPELGVTDAETRTVRGRWDVFASIVLALIGAAESMSIGMSMLRPIFAIEDHRALILTAGLATGLAGGFALYVFAMHLLGKPKKRRLFRFSAALLLAFCAFELGTITTLIAFGASSPWGYVVEGLSGPLFGWLEGVISVAWWPVFFIAGFAIATGVGLHLWEAAKVKGFVTPDGVRS